MSIQPTFTPLMQQYHDIKNEYPDTIILFQVGDFFELFFDDAKTAAACLGIALTQRGKMNGVDIPLCGVPLHALNHYLPRLIRAGHKVALCEQLEPPTPGKVVARGVTKVFTPGTLLDEQLLDANSASFLFSFFPTDSGWGLLFGELLTAQLHATVIPVQSNSTLDAELVRFFPDEILVPENALGKSFISYFKQRGYYTTLVNDITANADRQEPFTQWMNSFRSDAQAVVNTHAPIRSALATFHQYINKNQHAALSQFNNLTFYEPDDFVMLDAATQRNLELIKNSQNGTAANTLFSVLNRAATPMGARTIKKWLVRPLVKQEQISARQDAVELLINDIVFCQQSEKLLGSVGDIERVIGRIAVNRGIINDYRALISVLELVPQFQQLLAHRQHVPLLKIISANLGNFSALHELLRAGLNDDPRSEWIIKEGFDARLDRIRALVSDANSKLIELERSEQQKTGINSLKVRFNGAHGYYIEVTNSNLDAVPDYYIRKQTLVGRERFITTELQTLALEIERAQSDIAAVEQELFERLKRDVAEYTSSLRKMAHALAHFDALYGFARVAYDQGYIRPQLNDNRTIMISAGRHPVVEAALGSSFIANDTQLTDDASLWIITGPNMGGKSTYLRQVALITLMAHCGSFVPAHAASIAIVDRIFTRIGAGDNLAEGKSTFLVEMEETAAICTQATRRSLVILDEVGRGTSTFDGLAIAQAVVEYLYTSVGARCLFATHYHELTALEAQFPGIVSYYAASKRTRDGIVLLHTIVRGVADGSFGIEVAKLAQLPRAIIDRADDIVTSLQSTPHMIIPAQKILSNPALEKKIALLTAQLESQQQMIKAVRDIEFDELSPKKAFDILWSLKQSL